MSAVTHLRYPAVTEWPNQDLFWPDDRRWFAATDVDFWSVYVGGAPDFIDQLASTGPFRPSARSSSSAASSRFRTDHPTVGRRSTRQSA